MLHWKDHPIILRTIIKNYAKLRILYWNCEGECEYSDSIDRHIAYCGVEVDVGL